MIADAGSEVSLENMGYPGYLTEEEFAVFVSLQRNVLKYYDFTLIVLIHHAYILKEQFRTVVKSRSESFRSTVFPFQDSHEGEQYALW